MTPNLFSPSQYAVRVHILGGNGGSEHPDKIYSPSGEGRGGSTGLVDSAYVEYQYRLLRQRQTADSPDHGAEGEVDLGMETSRKCLHPPELEWESNYHARKLSRLSLIINFLFNLFLRFEYAFHQIQDSELLIYNKLLFCLLDIDSVCELFL